MTDINYRIIGTEHHGQKFMPKGSSRMKLPGRCAADFSGDGESAIDVMVTGRDLEFRLETVSGGPYKYHVWVPIDVEPERVMEYVLHWALRPGTASKATEVA